MTRVLTGTVVPTVHAALATVLILVVCALVGLLIVPRRLRPRHAHVLLPTSLSIGAAAVGWVTWVVGTLGGTTAALWVFAVGAVLSLTRGGDLVRIWRRAARRLGLLARAGWLPAIGLVLLLLPTIPSLLGPVADSDGLRYHVALPKLFLLEGRVFTYPWDVTGAFPQLTEMLYMVGLRGAGPQTAKLIHWSFFVLALVVLATAVHRDRRTRRVAFLAPLLFAASPVALAVAPAAFVDGVALFHVAVAVLLVSVDAHPLLIGACAGAALGTKYTVAPAVLAVLATALARQRRHRPRTLASLLLPALLVTAPFLIRNTLVSGDPVFPIGHGLVGRPIPHLAAGAAGLTPAYHRQVPGLLGITWFRGAGRAQPDEVAGLHHLVGLLALLVAIPYRPARVFLAPVLAYALLGAWFHPPTRYLLPMLWCLSALEATALGLVLRGRRAAWLAAALAVPAAAGGVAVLHRSAPPWAMLRGRVSREEFLARTVPGYRAARFVNALPAGGVVMALDFPAPLYLDRPWIAEGVLNEPVLETWLAEGDSGVAVLRRLVDLDVRYLIVTPGYGGGSPLSLLPLATSPPQRRAVLELRSRLRRLATLDGVDVYEVPGRR